MSEALISLHNTAFSYDGQHAACNLSFSVHDGDYLAIIGSNGSGKSTLVKGLAGLLTPTHGKVKFGDKMLRRDIGYLPQQSSAQKSFPASVFEVALSGRLNKSTFAPFYSRSDKQATLELLAKLNVETLQHKCFGELSGGQQQRILLARAINSANRLLLLDEPTAGLDPNAQEDFYKIIASLDLTIIMVTHDLNAALKHASHILQLDTEQRFFGTVASYNTSCLGKDFVGCVHPHGHSEDEHSKKLRELGDAHD